jgi:hypothetical protein
MDNDYLWDRSGDDAEVRKLEDMLAVYRFTWVGLSSPTGRAKSPSHVVTWRHLAAAAAIILVVGAEVWWSWPPPRNEWRATEVSGTATVTPRAVLAAGEIVKTGSASRVRLEASAIGIVDVGENTTLRLIENRNGRHILALGAGTIHARTLSPPGVFVVDTPRARAIDLGCEYRLSVAPNGTGELHVSAGWVELTRNFTQSLVPQGAAAIISGDGTLSAPYFEDASPAFQDAVRHYDLPVILRLARRRDALTILNLFSRATPDERQQIYDRLNQLVPAPATISRDSMRLWTPRATEAWWPPVLQASGVSAIKKKKGMLRGL